MVLAGCTSSENMKEIESEVSKEILPSTVDLTWTTLTDQITLGETARLSFTLQIEPAIPVSVEPLVISPTFSQVSNLSWTDNSDMYQLQFSPDKAGEYQVKISVREIEFSGTLKEDYDFFATITSVQPIEDAPTMTIPSMIFLEEPNIIWIEGEASHSDVSTCELRYSLYDDEGSITVTENGDWKALFDFTEIEDTVTISLVISCGEYTKNRVHTPYKSFQNLSWMTKMVMALAIQLIVVRMA